jgi:hypothetical protein
MKKILCLVALVFGGCGVEELGGEELGGEELGGEGLGGVSAQLGADCDPLVCPGNSDLLAVLGFYELDATGAKSSPRGFRIASMTHNGSPVTQLEVPGARLQATTAAGVISGPNLIGLKLTVKHKSGKAFDLLIDDYLTSKVPYYAGGSPDIEGYHILYGEAGEHITKEPCPYETYVDGSVSGSWAVFWKGDRYDPDTGEIFASNAQVGPWFNISCAGEAAIKMLRTRTGGAVAPLGAVAQRQATLNMFTASYCGPTGQRYTKLGQAIAWSDLSGPSQAGAVESYEAVWSETGAVCLDVPRLFDPAEIPCYAAIPRCTAADIGGWAQLGWLLSGNPPPAP